MDISTSNSHTRPTLEDALLQWLDDVRVSMMEAWAKKAVPPVKTVQRILAYRKYERVGEREAKWALNFKQESVEVSEFRQGTGVPVLFKFDVEPPGELICRALRLAAF